MAERLYILDAHSLIYQVFHAIAEMTSPSGMPTNAVFGFVRDIEMIRNEKKPDYLVCAFDSPGETFRHAMAADYKATRKEMPDDLRPQIDMIRRILAAYGIPVLAEPGIEADDFLASVGVAAEKRKILAYLCTADKDVRQVVGDYAKVYDLRRGRVIDREYVVRDWGVTPEQVVDYQAMVGDSVDNIKGIPGIGPKSASQLLQKYGTLENIAEHVDEISAKKMRENFVKGKRDAIACRELVRLKTDLPLPENWDAWRLREPDRKALLELFGECGFHRFAESIRGGVAAEPVEWRAEYTLVRDPAGLDEMLADLSRRDRLSVDLETTNIRPTEAEIVGYAIATEPGKAYYVAVRAPEEETELRPDDVADRLRPLLENPEIEKVGQNLKYDMIVLRVAGVELRGVGFDTMVASYLLEPGERIHNLDELSQRLLGHETIKISALIGAGGKGKPQLAMNEVSAQKVCEYAGEDADVALRLTELLEPALKKSGQYELFKQLECPLIEVLADMEFNGIRVDPDLLRSLSAECGRQLEQIEEKIHAAAGKIHNLDSPLQLRKLLFEDLGLPIVKRTKTGASTDQEVLEELSDRHPVCAMLLERRKLAKLKGTYLDALPTLMHPLTGRIHASFNQTVAATGRLSSSDPNLQNIPVRTEEGRQIRQAFLAGKPGLVLLSADYSQIELRLLAHFSGDENLTRAFQEDQDIHAVVAARIEGVELENVTYEMRRRAKAVNFGIMYGLSPFGLAKQLKIDQEAAAAFIDAYFEQYPGIDAFFTEVLTGAKKNRYVSTILGRRRPVSGIKNTTGRVRNLPERTAINTVIQGSAADLIKRAMLQIHRRLKASEFDAKMLLQIHDELVFEVVEDQAERFGGMVNAEMTEAIPLRVPLKVDIGVGPNWLDLESLALSAVAG